MDTLVIPAGSARATIRVPVLDDVINDGGETLTLTLSNLSGDGVFLEDATAVGTIRNTDPLPRAWLARFGRAAAVQVTDLLTDRFEQAGNSPDRLTLGGRPVDVTALRRALDDPSSLYRPDAGDAAARGQHNVRDVRGQSNITPDPAVSHGNEDVTLTPGAAPAPGGVDSAEPEVQAAQNREATLLERTLWTLLNSRGRVQFDARQFLAQSRFDVSLTDLAARQSADRDGRAPARADGGVAPAPSVETVPAAPATAGPLVPVGPRRPDPLQRPGRRA